MKSFKLWLRDTRGNAAIMFGAAAVPLLLASGMAIDMVRLSQVRTVLQAAVDSAAIAGATSGDMTDGEVDKVVRNYLEENGSVDVLDHVSAMSHWKDTDGSTFNVRIEGKLKTSLMTLAGIGDMDLDISSQANLGQQAIELALVLDNTGSMAGSKIEALKTSAKELIRIINDAKSDYSSMKVAVVPFSQYVNVGTDKAGQVWLNDPSALAAWQGCVGSRNSPNDEREGSAGGEAFTAVETDYCTAPLLPLTSNISAINQRIDAMTSEGNTFIPGGLLWGWNVLSSSAPFTEGMTETQLKAKNGRKVIVLMTDGANTLSPNYPDHIVGNTSLADQKLASICENVKSDNYTLYTVSFMVTDTNIKSLLTACASSTANAFDADNATELYAAFNTIGQQLAAVRLTK